MAEIEEKAQEANNGAALAAFMAAGIGAFAMGFFVILHEAGLFSAPPSMCYMRRSRPRQRQQRL